MYATTMTLKRGGVSALQQYGCTTIISALVATCTCMLQLWHWNVGGVSALLQYSCTTIISALVATCTCMPQLWHWNVGGVSALQQYGCTIISALVATCTCMPQLWHWNVGEVSALQQYSCTTIISALVATCTRMLQLWHWNVFVSYHKLQICFGYITNLDWCVFSVSIARDVVNLGDEGGESTEGTLDGHLLLSAPPGHVLSSQCHHCEHTLHAERVATCEHTPLYVCEGV